MIHDVFIGDSSPDWTKKGCTRLRGWFTAEAHLVQTLQNRIQVVNIPPLLHVGK